MFLKIKNKKSIKIILFTFLAVSFLFFNNIALAFDPLGNPLANEQGKSVSVANLVGRVVQVMMISLGVLAFAVFAYAGIMWLAARGDKDKITESKVMIINAVYGMLLAFVAYYILIFIIKGLGDIFG